MPKLNYEEALQALNEDRPVRAEDVQAAALKRKVYFACANFPGCLPGWSGYFRTKADAVESCVEYAGDDAPRGMVAALRSWGIAEAFEMDVSIESGKLEDFVS